MQRGDTEFWSIGTKSSLRSDFLEYIKLYLIYYEKQTEEEALTEDEADNSR